LSTKWLKLEVIGLTFEHYTNLSYPPFSIRLVRSNGADILNPNNEILPDVPISISVHNKWTEVTDEVLSSNQHIRSLHNGELLIDDWTFVDFSLAHGGFFKLHISALEHGAEVADWWSDKFVILSAKSRPKKLRKQRRVEESVRPVRHTRGKRERERGRDRDSFEDDESE
jgi:hypothetical protein